MITYMARKASPDGLYHSACYLPSYSKEKAFVWEGNGTGAIWQANGTG